MPFGEGLHALPEPKPEPSCDRQSLVGLLARPLSASATRVLAAMINLANSTSYFSNYFLSFLLYVQIADHQLCYPDTATRPRIACPLRVGHGYGADIAWIRTLTEKKRKSRINGYMGRTRICTLLAPGPAHQALDPLDLAQALPKAMALPDGELGKPARRWSSGVHPGFGRLGRARRRRRPPGGASWGWPGARPAPGTTGTYERTEENEMELGANLTRTNR